MLCKSPHDCRWCPDYTSPAFTADGATLKQSTFCMFSCGPHSHLVSRSLPLKSRIMPGPTVQFSTAGSVRARPSSCSPGSLSSSPFPPCSHRTSRQLFVSYYLGALYNIHIPCAATFLRVNFWDSSFTPSPALLSSNASSSPPPTPRIKFCVAHCVWVTSTLPAGLIGFIPQ